MGAILDILSVLIAPLALMIWSLVSAYVFRLGLRGSGIGFDYFIFTLIVIGALVVGGVV